MRVDAGAGETSVIYMEAAGYRTVLKCPRVPVRTDISCVDPERSVPVAIDSANPDPASLLGLVDVGPEPRIHVQSLANRGKRGTFADLLVVGLAIAPCIVGSPTAFK